MKNLIEWSRKHYSDLPWRQKRSSYNTLVSEIMLQQTTVSTVINHFDRFIEKYPTIDKLSKIEEEQILIDWKGLGYYRRAKNLLKASKDIKEKFGSEIPLDFDKLKSINGVGDYTANAILAIGNNINAICVDANLERVLSRVYGIKALKGPKLQKEVYRLYKEEKICTEINSIGARDYNEALMDLGRSICKARSAACEICPIKSKCVAYKEGKPLAYPIENKLAESKKRESFDLRLLRVLYKRDGKFLAYKKSKTEWLSGQYEVPTFILNSEDLKLKQYPELQSLENFDFLPEFKSSITKYKIVNKVLWVSEAEMSQVGIKVSKFDFVSEDKLSTGSLKALKI